MCLDCASKQFTLVNIAYPLMKNLYCFNEEQRRLLFGTQVDSRYYLVTLQASESCYTTEGTDTTIKRKYLNYENGSKLIAISMRSDIVFYNDGKFCLSNPHKGRKQQDLTLGSLRKGVKNNYVGDEMFAGQNHEYSSTVGRRR